jgi:hypothetical protein
MWRSGSQVYQKLTSMKAWRHEGITAERIKVMKGANGGPFRAEESLLGTSVLG